MKSNGRNPEVDVAKGIVILLMVVGHCYCQENIILKLICAFHMPFFFIVTGYLTKENHTKIGGLLSKNSLIKTWIPYLGYSMLYGLLLYSIRSISSGCLEWNPLFQDLVKIVTLQGLSALWFIPCNFFARLIVVVINKYFSKAGFFLSAAIMLLGLCLDMPDTLTVFRRMLVSIGFVATGYYGHEWIAESTKSGGVFCLCTISFLFTGIVNSSVSMFANSYGNILLYYISSIAGTLMTFYAATRLSEIKNELYRILQYLGQNTLIILGTHMLIVEIIRIVDNKLFDSVLPHLGLYEGIVFASIVILLEIPVICAINNYMPFLAGRKLKRKISIDSL